MSFLATVVAFTVKTDIPILTLSFAITAAISVLPFATIILILA